MTSSTMADFNQFPGHGPEEDGRKHSYQYEKHPENRTQFVVGKKTWRMRIKCVKTEATVLIFSCVLGLLLSQFINESAFDCGYYLKII